MKALLLLLLTPLFARAEPPVQLSYYEDKSAALTAEEVVARSGELAWTPVAGNQAQFGYSASRFWVRVRMPRDAQLLASEPWVLEVPFVYNDRVGLYVVEHGRITKSMFAGLAVARSTREPDVNATGFPSFRLGPPHSPQGELFLSAEGTFPVSLPVRLVSSREYGLTASKTQLLLGILIGIYLLALASNAILAISLRSPLYAKYAGYVAALTMLFLAHEGLTTLFLWSDSPWWATRELDLYGGLAIICYGMFVREFLATRKNTPVLERVLLFLIAISTVRMVWMVVHPYRFAQMLGVVAVFSMNLLVLVIAARAWRKNVRTARYFLLASLCYNLGYVLFLVQNGGVFWFGEWVDWAPMVGATLEVSLLSFALADRIGQTDRELVQQRVAVVQADKLRALGRMAGEIAHEINNPLAIIHGNAALLRSLDTSEQAREYATTIEVTAKRISNMVRGMRALARDSRQDPLRPTPVSIVLQDALLLCRERSREVNFEVQQPAEDFTLRCRSSEISQVLVNLLNNSFDAVDGVKDPKVTLEVARRAGMLELAVTDNGPGVPADLRPRIQEPFFTTKEAGKGLGLGLSISRTIVESHKGSLWLDEKSAVTRFVFTVPVG